MTISQNVATKLFVGAVAVSMLFSLSFVPAQAATAAELQAEIDKLMEQIASLQGGSMSGGASMTFTMDLTIGASGAEVTALQNFLIGKGFSIPAGATGYFGTQTQSALAAFQSANGISPAAGYFGPITRAKVNGMGGGSTGGSTGGSSSDLSGEASLDKFQMNSGEDTDIEEGQEDAPVADMDVEFTDGDALISRIDLMFTSDTANVDDAWDTFEEISLWVDDEEVGRVAADDEDDWLDEDDGTIRISGLDIVVPEDEKTTITVAVTVQTGLDTPESTWDVGAVAVRYTDGDDVTTTDSSTEDLDDSTPVTTDFDISEEGGDDELVVRSSDDNPDATTLKVEDDGRSDWLEVFAFNLDTDDSTNDITINDLPIQFNFSSSTASTYINDVRVVVDGETYDDFEVGSGSASSTYTFDTDGDLVIDAGDEVTAMVEVQFKQLALGNEGVTFSATTSASDYDAEGADDLEGGQLSGSQSSETHTLRTTGVTISGFDWEVSSTGTLVDFFFTIAADDGDFTIDPDTDIATTSSGNATSSTGVLSVFGDDSDTSAAGNGFTVEEGGDATFRLRFTLSGDEGTSKEWKVTSVGGQEVPSADQTSPTAIIDNE